MLNNAENESISCICQQIIFKNLNMLGNLFMLFMEFIQFPIVAVILQKITLSL